MIKDARDTDRRFGTYASMPDLDGYFFSSSSSVVGQSVDELCTLEVGSERQISAESEIIKPRCHKAPAHRLIRFSFANTRRQVEGHRVHITCLPTTPGRHYGPALPPHFRAQLLSRRLLEDSPRPSSRQETSPLCVVSTSTTRLNCYP